MRRAMPSSHDNDGYPLRPVNFTPAAIFIPPGNNDTSETLFTDTQQLVLGSRGRFLRRGDRHQMLIYTYGCCLYNCNSDPARYAVGGCAFRYKGGLLPRDRNGYGVVKFCLEDRGPSGVAHIHTCNRAELRAVIAALQYLDWNSENRTQLVIATDSSYVVWGATDWVQEWVTSGWRTSSGSKVKNMDLWESLFKEIQLLKLHPANSIRVLFWWIPIGWNTVAENAAKEAAETKEPRQSFTKLCGGLLH